MAMRTTFYLCLAIFLLTATTSGQTIPTTQPQQDDRIIVGTNLVTVNVIVTDGKGRYVKDLSQDQFTIYDNKVKQQIVHFSMLTSPVSIGIILEIHKTAPEKTPATPAAMKQFTSTLRSEDDFFFTAFSEDGNVTTEFIPSWEQILGQSPAHSFQPGLFWHWDLPTCSPTDSRRVLLSRACDSTGLRPGLLRHSLPRHARAPGCSCPQLARSYLRLARKQSRRRNPHRLAHKHEVHRSCRDRS